ncbi:MAG: ABC transporter substrate-binding protein [Treponema sp.]|jgi:lactose/L-arabinose transport system substrate-binding protein|nr:ABC transporter substrate-binding protein [Treponema sp.]
MRKVLCGCLALFAVLGACKKAETAADPNAPVTVTVWCWDPNFNIYAMNEAAKIYKAVNPNVTVNVVETPWNDLQQKLITALGANQTASLPDILLMQDNAMQKNLQTYPNAFAPLGDKIDLTKFAQSKVDYGSMDGKYYGVPFDNGATATFLRRDIVEEAGLKVEDFNNITWERFLELGKIVKQKTGISLVSIDSTGPDFIMIMLQGAGTWLFDPQGKTYINNNPVLKRSIELVIEMVNSGVMLLAADWNEYIATINNSRTASTIQGCWIIGSIVAEPSQSGKWAMVNTPKFASIDSVNYSSQGGSGWLVLSSSKNVDASIDFLAKTFAGSQQFYETILPSSGAIATWLPMETSSVYGQPHPFFGGQKVYEELIGFIRDVPQVKYGIFNYEARDEVTKALMSIMQGSTDIQAALDAAQRNVEFIVNQ